MRCDDRLRAGHLYITVLVVYVQAVPQLLPFSIGISLSRRTFYLGTALVAVAQALFYGVAIAALVAIEKATDGWGAGMQYWAPGISQVDNFFFQALASGAPMLAFMSVGIGIGIGIVHQRWGQNGTWGLIIASMVVVGGLALLITWLEVWRDVADWFAATLTVGLPLAVATVAAIVSFPGVRRVVP